MDIEQHYVALRELIERVRSQGGPVRVLSDVTHGVRQAGWVEDYPRSETQMFEAGGRIALLTANAPDREGYSRTRK